MQGWKLAGVLSAAVVGGMLATALPGNAQKNKPKSEINVGFVDLTKVTDQVKGTQEWQVLVKKYEDMKTQFEEQIEDLNRTRYLSKAELEELKTLRAKPKASDAEKKRIETLEGQSDNLDREFSKLAGTEKLTAEEQTRLTAIDGMRKSGINALQEEANKRRVELGKLQGEVLDGMQEKILKKVIEVADNKELVLVLDRQAVLSGGQDLTADVLRKLGAAPAKP